MFDEWLTEFKNAWEQHDIDRVMGLLSKEVVYFESPFQQLETLDDIRHEWQVVMAQENIELDYTIAMQTDEAVTVLWTLAYNKDGAVHEVSGIWIIVLNEEQKCSYFYQVCESK